MVWERIKRVGKRQLLIPMRMFNPISANLSRRSIIYDNSEEFQMIHRSSASRPQTWMIIPKWIKITTGYGPDADHTYGTHYPAHGPDKGNIYTPFEFNSRERMSTLEFFH